MYIKHQIDCISKSKFVHEVKSSRNFLINIKIYNFQKVNKIISINMVSLPPEGFPQIFHFQLYGNR